MRFCFLLCVLVLCAAGSSAAQQRADSAVFIVRIGTDTSSVERYIRKADQLIVEAVQRSPSTMLHRLVLDVTPQHAVTRAVYAIMRPNSDDSVLARTITFDRDSATVVTVQGAATRTARVAARDAIPIAGPFYAPYELAMMRAVASKAPKFTVQLLQPNATVSIPFERVGRDSLTLTNQFGEPMRAHVDASGRLLHLHTRAFTTVERTGWLDFDALTRAFAARDTTGKGLGPLSPRHAYRAAVGEANIWVDYSRPSARGRPIWGALVPYGSVWRMGANEAAHFATDRSLDLGGLKLEPGTYTLFLLPTADDWQLIVNRRTRIAGLDHEAAHDVGRVKLATQTLERPAEQFTIDVQNNMLSVAWGNMKGSVPIKVAE